MVRIGEAPVGTRCDDCQSQMAIIRIEAGSAVSHNTILLCEQCHHKLAYSLAPKTATLVPTRDDVRKMVVAKTEHVKDSLEKTVQSLLHNERNRTNQLVETTAANLRASIAAAIPRATDSTNCCSSFRIIGGNDIVHCIKVAGHGHEHEGRCYGRAFYWENPGEGPA